MSIELGTIWSFALLCKNTENIQLRVKEAKITIVVTEPEINEWIHLAATFDTANISVYKNGILQETRPIVGKANLDILDTFKGETSNIATWNRPLSVEEIKTIALTGNPNSVPTGLVYNEYSIPEEPDDAVQRDAAAFFSAQIENRVKYTQPAVSKPIFTVRDGLAGNFVRNPECWAADIDLTCCSMWNSYSHQNNAGTLISPRHIVFAKHFTPILNTIMYFVTRDNTLVTRTLVGTNSVLNTDILIGVLDSDVPEDITFAKILPDNWQKYLSNGLRRTPALTLDAEEKAIVSEIYYVGNYIYYSIPPTNIQLAPFHETPIVGDSGNPCFLVGKDEVGLLSTWYFSSGGPSILYYKNEINSIMIEQGGGYQLTPMDFSNFSEI